MLMHNIFKKLPKLQNVSQKWQYMYTNFEMLFDSPVFCEPVYFYTQKLKPPCGTSLAAENSKLPAWLSAGAIFSTSSSWIKKITKLKIIVLTCCTVHILAT